MSQKKIKYTISLAALLLVVLLGFLLITRFGIPIGEKLNVADDSCKMHKNTPDPNCETCYPRPEYEKDTQSIAISETRIRESYKPDTLYIQTANVECVSRGTYKRFNLPQRFRTQEVLY